jgi:hypothetical protein
MVLLLPPLLLPLLLLLLLLGACAMVKIDDSLFTFFSLIEEGRDMDSLL